MLLYDYVPHDLLQEHVNDGFISIQSHPKFPLAIANYTNKTQFEGVWDEATTKCRGLIYNTETLDIVARPFPKFFNHDQPQAPDWQAWDWADVEITEKVDGSLGILYPWDGEYYVATRGSFTSEQAIKGTQMLHKMLEEDPYLYKFLHPNETTLVEIVYPANRIVVDYGNYEGLVYLQTIDIATGEDRGFPGAWPGRVAMNEAFGKHEILTDVAVEENSEGWVLYNWRTNERVKVKNDEYKRLHKLLTGVSSRTIWELLSTNQPLEQILDVVPDEFYSWVMSTAEEMHSGYYSIMARALGEFLVYEARSQGLTRKDFALMAKDSEFRDILFGLYDKKNVSSMIWKRLKPSFAKPFHAPSEMVS